MLVAAAGAALLFNPEPWHEQPVNEMSLRYRDYEPGTQLVGWTGFVVALLLGYKIGQLTKQAEW